MTDLVFVHQICQSRKSAGRNGEGVNLLEVFSGSNQICLSGNMLAVFGEGYLLGIFSDCH